MSDGLQSLALGCLLPGFVGTTAPAWLLGRLDRGLAGVTLYARNVASHQQLAELTARLHGAGSDVVVAIDEEGGDITKLEAATGSSYPGNLALGHAADPHIELRFPVWPHVAEYEPGHERTPIARTQQDRSGRRRELLAAVTE